MSYIEWGILGLFLVLMELFMPGVFLVWFGLAGLCVSLGVYWFFIPEVITWQLFWFSIFSCISTCLGLWLYRMIEKKFKKESEYVNLNDLASQYIGKVVTLTQDVVDGKSKVSVGDTVWIARVNEDLLAGDKVVITGVEKGVILIVQKQ